MQGSSLLALSAEDEAMAYLALLIRDCCEGPAPFRSAVYWHACAWDALRGRPEHVLAEWRPIFRRARWLAQFCWEQNPNHPTHPNPTKEVPDGLFD